MADDDEFMFAEPLKRRPPGPYERAYLWVRARRNPRLLEFLFFAVPGAMVVVTALELDWHGWLRDPLALLLGLVGVGYGAFGLLPPTPKPRDEGPLNPRSLRAKRKRNR